jgi:hypothetical protein
MLAAEEMTMTGSFREQEIEELKAELARVREEIAARSAGADETAGGEAGKPGRTDEQGDGKGKASTETGEKWADVRQSFDEVRNRVEQLLEDLAALIERHPVGTAVTAFGLGFIIAKLMGQGRDRDKGHH